MVVVEHVARSFPNGSERLELLQDVTFAVSPGERLAVTGASGSGKSTLLSLIAGLDAPDSGSITVANRTITGMDTETVTRFRARHIGLVFQFHYLLRDFTAEENVMLPAYIAGTSRRDAFERARELMEELGIIDRRERLPAQLSGGERQRLACARALMNDPDVVLADEPTGNLDEENSAILTELLFDLVARREKSLILVTHDTALAGRCERVLRLEGGELRAVA